MVSFAAGVNRRGLPRAAWTGRVSSGMHVRVCRECGEEYRPEIALCADCGGELEDRHDEDPGLDPGRPAPIEEPALPPGDYRAIYSSAHAAELEPLAEKLGAAGIPFDVRGSFQAFELLVRKEDIERAVGELAPLLDEVGAPASQTGSETAQEDRRCPACSGQVPPGVGECPECGLVVAGSPDARVCSRCGVPVGPEEEECASCRVKVEG